MLLTLGAARPTDLYWRCSKRQLESKMSPKTSPEIPVPIQLIMENPGLHLPYPLTLCQILHAQVTTKVHYHSAQVPLVSCQQNFVQVAILPQHWLIFYAEASVRKFFGAHLHPWLVSITMQPKLSFHGFEVIFSTLLPAILTLVSRMP